MSWWLPGAGGVGRATGFQFCKMERVKKSGGDGFTAPRVYSVPLNCVYLMVKKVNVMLCVFYHNKQKRKIR